MTSIILTGIMVLTMTTVGFATEGESEINAAAYSGGLSAAVLIPSIIDNLITYSRSDPQDNFWVRSYKYGYNNVASRYANVYQTYTGSYYKVHNSSDKYNSTTYPF